VRGAAYHLRHLAQAVSGALAARRWRAALAGSIIAGMDRVSATAAALLRLESPTAPLHLGWFARLERRGGETVDVAALLERIAARLARAPRLRQVAAPVADGGGGLLWREDARFDVGRHVDVWPGAAATEEELQRALEVFLAEPLERDRPLWRLLVVPATRGGGGALAGKVHRALADGHDAGRLRELVFDDMPGPASGARGAAADVLALDEYRMAHRMHAIGAGPADAVRIGATLRRVALAHTVGRLRPAAPSFLDRTSARRRTFVTARIDAGRVARIAAKAGATDHDVVLALAAGALRRLALASGVEPVDMRALVPLDVAGEELLGDAPCAVLELPLAERRAAARLEAVREGMAAALGATRAAADRSHDGAAVLAGPPEELATRLAIGARVSNVTIPSAAAPAGALHLGGTRVRALFPVTPAPDEHALALGTLAYERHVHIGATADAETVRGVQRLPLMLADAVEELAVPNGVRASPRTGPDRRSGRR
jgi:diacylglycerol O-acyltransferase / wax synthase